jgi:hypothetical protein
VVSAVGTGTVKHVSGCLAVVPEGAGPASDSKERHMARGHGQGCDLRTWCAALGGGSLVAPTAGVAGGGGVVQGEARVWS